MDASSLFSYWAVEPLASWGFVGKQWQVNLDTLIFSWAGMALLFAAVIVIRRWYFRPDNLVYVGIEYFIESFATMCADSIGYFRYDYFCFITTMFLFTFSGCVISMLPFMEEATRDANTTFALGISSFLYVSYQHVRQEGLLSYLKHYLGHEGMPMIIRILMMPLETLGQVSRIISMGFRLFGNILGGAVVYHVLLGAITAYREHFVWAVCVGGLIWVVFYRWFGIGRDSGLGKWLNSMIQCLFVITAIQMFFGIFEALIQSFVIAMLSITYLSLAIHHNLKRDERGLAWT